LDVRATALRALAGAIFAAFAGILVLHYLPTSGAPAAMAALLAGGLIALPFIRRELRLLMNL